MQYAGFWRRFGAYWIDIVIMVPVCALVVWGEGVSRLFQLYYFLPGLLLTLWYHVHLVERYGGTPGKLLMKMKIVRTDGTAVRLEDAFMRFSVSLTLGLLMNIAIVLPVLQMTDQEYHSLGFLMRGKVVTARAPGWYQIVYILLQVWVWSEFVTMLTNKRRRALHDFMAGTVVVRTQRLNNK